MGENHDHGPTHAWQLRTTKALHAQRPDLVLSMEMWERDNQNVLNQYLAAISMKPTYLRTQGLAKLQGGLRTRCNAGPGRMAVPVVAANCPRSLASQVYKEGLDSVAGNPMIASEVDTGEGAYYKEFARLLFGSADHGGDDEDMLRKMYAAQCVKDDTMAESIAQQMPSGQNNSKGPLVVHWCGRAHSDRWLGTVERTATRLPTQNWGCEHRYDR